MKLDTVNGKPLMVKVADDGGGLDQRREGDQDRRDLHNGVIHWIDTVLMP